ncbi:MAG: hypothetical protein KGI50_01005 [Patescibacteria group bacterium]|nr:hypothetical protein [Patescibacteria group bacterium]MDE2438070.1 hypothetical protein [Patescibacteria group bacterium]
MPQLHSYPGTFILFEGLSGSGKTFQARRVHEELQRQDGAVLLNQEPTSGVFGAIIREVIEKRTVPARLLQQAGQALHEHFPRRFDLLDMFVKIAEDQPLNEQERQAVFLLDRFDDLHNTIHPALQREMCVVQDRYDLSTYAYYSAAQPDAAEAFHTIDRLHEDIVGSLYIVPDLIFLFDLPASVAVERLRASGKTMDMYERERYLSCVRKSYRMAGELAATKTQVHLVDASRSKDEVTKEILGIVNEVV